MTWPKECQNSETANFTFEKQTESTHFSAFSFLLAFKIRLRISCVCRDHHPSSLAMKHCTRDDKNDFQMKFRVNIEMSTDFMVHKLSAHIHFFFSVCFIFFFMFFSFCSCFFRSKVINNVVVILIMLKIVLKIKFRIG